MTCHLKLWRGRRRGELQSESARATAVLPDRASRGRYGNYLAQQLFGACNAEMRCAILERLLPCAREIACDRRGTHSLQVPPRPYLRSGLRLTKVDAEFRIHSPKTS